MQLLDKERQRQREAATSDCASGRESRGRPGCEGQLSRWAVETNVAMDIRLGCGGSERSGKVQVNRIESMVVRRRELIQYGDVAGGKRSVAVAAVCGSRTHGTAASVWVRVASPCLARLARRCSLSRLALRWGWCRRTVRLRRGREMAQCAGTAAKKVIRVRINWRAASGALAIPV